LGAVGRAAQEALGGVQLTGGALVVAGGAPAGFGA
jgi:hypothetical protein